VDYGDDSEAWFGETLQAVEKHKFASVLENPGEADLSSHVDFAALARTAEGAGASSHGPIAQGTLLARLGIEQRSQRLRQMNPNQETDITAAVKRLTSPEQMGTLFKALAIVSREAPVPAGF
jgi:NADH dehydrogenase [ubiquinone] 1 alpha subcomplex assembly factor 7